MINLKGKYTDAKLFNDNIESQCIEQIKGMINTPAFTEQVRIMPDAHFGKGSCVGFTMPVGDKLVPATIGVDIGCGIYAYRTDVTKEFVDNLGWELIDKLIRKAVPLGFSRRQGYTESIEDIEYLVPGITELTKKLDLKEGDVVAQLGSLGGGNHFIEFAQSSNDGHLWLLIHTGSRNLGMRTCDYHQKKAIANIKTLRSELIDECMQGTEPQEREAALKSVKETEIFGVPEDQSWLEGKDKDEYLHDMYIAQKFAHLNKHFIRDAICNAVGLTIEESIESVHNYIDPKDNVIRKGAIRAYKDEKVVIPFNMRDGSILAKGKGNPDWNNSAPHGAGRVMSRSKAKKEITLDTFKEQMKDVWSSSVGNTTLDEAPDAYKPKAEIEDAIKDCVDVYDYLVPVYNLKSD